MRKMMRVRLAMVVMTVALLARCLDTVSANRRCGPGMKPYTRMGGPCVPDSASALLDPTTITEEDGAINPHLPPRRKLQAAIYASSAVGLVLLIAAIVGCICCCIHGCCGSRQVVVTQQVAGAPAAAQPQGAHQQNLVFQMPPNGVEMNHLPQHPHAGPDYHQGYHHHNQYAPADANVAVKGYPAPAVRADPQQAYYPPAPQQQQQYPPQQLHGSRATNHPRKIV